jgi:hypothetical protein
LSFSETNSVQIITFDELKAKLELLGELLGPPNSSEPDFEVDLEDEDDESRNGPEPQAS